MEDLEQREVARNSTARRHQSEAQLQLSFVEHLRWCARSDVWWTHLANGGYPRPTEAAIFKTLGVQPGAPDLLIVRAGQALFIECKAAGRKLSASQVECHEALRRAGAAVETADNVDQALGFLRLHGVLR
jgi:VRR-NUC domain